MHEIETQTITFISFRKNKVPSTNKLHVAHREGSRYSDGWERMKYPWSDLFLYRSHQRSPA